MKSKKNFVPSMQDVRLRRLSKMYQNIPSKPAEELTISKPSNIKSNPKPADGANKKLPKNTLKEKKRLKKAKAKNVKPAQNLLQKSHTPSLKETKWNEQLEELIQSDRPWKDFSQLAWREYTLEPTDRHAAKLVELAFLHGNHDDILACFERLLNLGEEGFYMHLDTVLRQKLIGFFFHSRLQDLSLIHI